MIGKSLAILGLWTIVVAQPLLDLLGGSPEFFAAHRAGATDILLVVSALVLLLPAILIAGVWLSGLPGARARATALGIVIAALVGALAMQIMKQGAIQTWTIAVPLAATAGILAAVAHHRVAVVRTLAALLSLAVIVVPAIFLTRPGIRRMVAPAASARFLSGLPVRALPGGLRPAPVVMMVLDETPLVSLLDAEGKIDPILYPNLAGLARDGIWFRNTTTVNDYTKWALPAIVSGTYPRADAVPTYVDHPETLFTLLGATHRLEVVETVTALCPSDLCRASGDPLGARLVAIADDLRIIYLHVLLTDDLRTALPALTGDWARFGARGETADHPDNPDNDVRSSPQAPLPPRGRDQQVALTFVDWIAADDPQPTFYFIHMLLPHFPWLWLPSGQRNATRAAIPGDLKGTWGDDEWGMAQYYQRHLLQLGLADAMVGRVIVRLKETGLYERTLLVVTADHGVSLRPGASRRDFSDDTAAEIMRVPLIIKFPRDLPQTVEPVVDLAGQHASDRNVETVDIAPTVADALGMELPWRADGVSLLDRSARERDSKKMFFGSAQGLRSYGPEGPDAAATLRHKLDIFGGSENVYRIPRPPLFGELIGRSLGDLRIDERGNTVAIDFLSQFDAVDLHADAVPFDVGGRIEQFDANGATKYLAVAVNGTVRAVTRTWSSDPGRWLATPPLDVWRDGPNDLEVFVVDVDAGGPFLRRTKSM